jgi:hypothetical protein
MTSVTFRRAHTIGGTSYAKGAVADLSDNDLRVVLNSSIAIFTPRTQPSRAHSDTVHSEVEESLAEAIHDNGDGTITIDTTP